MSWAWAWAEVKKRYPDTEYRVYENVDGLFYHTDGRTCWVKTGVTVNGIEHIEYLPVMDYRNRSIPLENVTSTDVNKAIQRSLTKAVARHGLGLYIYAGEDLPEGCADNAAQEKKSAPKKEPSKESSTPPDRYTPEYIDSIKQQTLIAAVNKAGWNADDMLRYIQNRFPQFPPATIKQVTIKQFTHVMRKLEEKAEKQVS